MTQTDSQHTMAMIAYVLHLVGAIAGLPSLIGLVINYLGRSESTPLVRSHHRWMIETFWWAIFWIIIGVIALVIPVGWVVLGLVWVWYVYRHVRVLDDREAPLSR